MPVYEFESPQGRFEVEAPDDRAALSAWEQISGPPKAKPSVAEDVAKSAGSGLVRGVTGLAGLPAAAADWLSSTSDYIAEKITGERVPQAIKTNPFTLALGTENLNRVVDRAADAPVTSYQPQTMAGEYARTIGEFAPGALVPGGAIGRAANVVVPAVATETVGQFTKGSPVEPYARAGTALATGIGVGVLSRPSSAQAAIRDAAGAVDDATLAQAGRLMQQSAEQGVALTWPEALAQVSGPGRLNDVQRVVEGSGALKPFMAQRPGQVQAAGAQALDNLAPAGTTPSQIGPALQRAAIGVTDDVEGAINQATRPLYRAAEARTIAPEDFARIREIPAFQEALRGLRGDPIMGPQFAQYGDDSVAVIDAVQKRVRDFQDAAAAGGEKFKAGIVGGQRGQVLEAADAAAPEYAAARQAQAHLREKYLQPLMDGPIGRIAQNDPATRRVIDTLFPQSPLPGAADEIGQAMTALAQKNPRAASEIVRAHAQSVFDEATQRLVGGPNEFGGAKFAAQLTGNSEQAKVLEAAVRALPNGDTRWEGFKRFLDTVEATGQRQRIGSQTEFNRELRQQLSTGKLGGEIGALASGGGLQIPARLREWYQGYRYGKNVDQLAAILTDPKAEPLLRAIMKDGSGVSPRNVAIATRLVVIGEQSRASAQPRK